MRRAYEKHNSTDPYNRHRNWHSSGSILIDPGNYGLTNFTATGSAQWIAANRDSIYTTIFGQAELSDVGGGSLKVTETHIITGGTGRFTGAQGSFTKELFHTLEAVGYPVASKRTTCSAHSTGPLLPRAQLTEQSRLARRGDAE